MTAYSSYNDQQLFALLQQDDERAFRELYERYWDKLLAQAFIRLKSTQEAEEIIQEVFLQLWRRRKTTLLKNTFHTYIAAAVKYEIFHRIARIEKEAASRQQLLHALPLQENSTLELSNYEMLRAKIEKTVQLLPEKCRLVFRLSREAGFSEKQIAEQLNIAPKTVEAHMSKALKSLRLSLRQFLGGILPGLLTGLTALKIFFQIY